MANTHNYIQCATMLVIILTLICLFCGCLNEEEPYSTEPGITYEAFITDNTGKEIPVYSAVEINNLDSALFDIDDKNRMIYNDNKLTTYTGIDVSQYQGVIDWEAVAADGIDFAMLRIAGRGYGAKGILYDDDSFEENYSGATQAGIKVGVYFFSQAISTAEAREEAEYAIDKLNGRTLDYPLVFDWEVIENEPNARTAGISNSTITECANSFCRAVEEANYIPVVYFNRSTGYDQYILSDINSYDFWIAEYTPIPNFYYNFSIWQYSTTGIVSGIEGEVDMNICFTDYSLTKNSINVTEDITY